MILKDEFRRLILEQLKDQGVSQSELARRMGVSSAMVSQYLTGSICPGVDVVERFCLALGFTPRLTLQEIHEKKLVS